jgi:hypothetical protein
VFIVKVKDVETGEIFWAYGLDSYKLYHALEETFAPHTIVLIEVSEKGTTSL